MLSTLIIVFREVLEAMLVVGIATAAAREVNIGARWIYGGLLAGLFTAMIVALGAEFIAASMQGMGQEYFNATVLLTAALLMSWTAIWMGKHGREISTRIRQVCKADEVDSSSAWILATVVALAVAREGAEVVLFLHGVAATGGAGSVAMLSGAGIGIVLGVLVAVVLYRSLIKLPIRHVFSVVTFLIVLLAAGMASQGVSYLVMIDELPALGQTIWNTSAVISERSALGQVLHALMGYDDRPSGMQLLAFVMTFSLTWMAVRWQKSAPKKAPQKAVVTAAVMLLLCSVSILPSDAEAKKVYSPIVEQGEVEFEYSLDYDIDADPAKNTNARHQFEMEFGVTDRWMTAIYGDFRKRPGQAFAYQGLKWENIYQLFEQGERYLDAGLYFEYIIPQRSLNKPDAFEFKLLLEKESGRLSNTFNLILKKELGAKAVKNTTIAYSWKSNWRWKRYLEPGIEMYAALGELGNTSPLSRQTHQVGPVLTGKFHNGINYEVGYLFGLTTASAQGSVKCILGYEF
ncbi:MAG: FTR1 family protein [Mariprofundus sp.]|nr:FTR1 family protein [Mariprofundus sp.]